MAACARCGEANPGRALYCWACGSALESANQPPLQVRKTVTVLFCDVTESTRLADREDPERMRLVMLRFFEEARTVLQRHSGTVEKFIGDAVMAVFGIPVLHEDDALRALRAASDLREAMVVLNGELDRSFGIRLQIRTGVNSGEVVAGDPSRSDTLVTGDAVNVAQRLEQAAAPDEILVGESTLWLARDAIRVESVGLLELKGLAEPVEAFRLLEIVPGALSHARRLDSPLVGRESERGILRQAFDRAVEERSCHLVTILGAEGVGKSRLVLEFATEVEGPATVLSGTCLPYGERITFWPVREVLMQATGITEDDPREVARAKLLTALDEDEDPSIAPAVEGIAGLIGLAEGGAADEVGFWGVRKLLETLARRRPVVVVLDDLHWAEPTLLDLIEHVTEWSREARILVVCTGRPALLDLRPAWGGGRRNAATIILEPLSETNSERLIHNLLGAEVLAGPVHARIHEAAGGNPLFLEEMLSMLIDDGLLWRENGRWAAAPDLLDVPVPPSIQVLLAARLDQLDAGERRVLERGAVEGKTFHRGAVEALSTADGADEVANYLAALVRKELIRPRTASFVDEDAFGFRHVLIRETAYEALPKHVRAELHERFAGWLEEVVGSRVAEWEEPLGYHLEQAFRYRSELARVDDRGSALAIRAGHRLASAGRRALARGDTSAAVNLLSRAGALLPEDDERRPSLLVELGVALRESGELARAEEVLLEALEHAQRSSDQLAEQSARTERAALRLSIDPGAAETEALVRQVEEGMPVLESLGDDRVLAQAWAIIGSALGLWKGRFARGEEALERALIHARRAGDRRQEAFIVGRLGFSAQWGPTPVPQAIERCRGILQQSGGDRLIEFGALRYLACLEARLGRFDEGRALAARATEGFEDLGMRLTAEAVRAFSSADIEILSGDYAAAERELRAAGDALTAMGERAYFPTVTAFLATALYGQGRFDEAEELSGTAQKSATSYDIWTHVLSLGVQAKVQAQRGQCADAEQLARAGLLRASGTDGLELHGIALLDLADALRLCKAAEPARPFIVEALGLFERKGVTVLAERARSLL